MPRTAKAHPFLPQDLVDKLKSEPSLVTSYFSSLGIEELRFGYVSEIHEAVDMEMSRDDTLSQFLMPMSLDHFGLLMDNMQHFQDGQEKNLLHAAIRDGDILMVHEALRMGITIDAKDVEGVTPLFFALEYICSMSKMLDLACIEFLVGMLPLSLLEAGIKSVEVFELQISRAVRSATLLVEQHADVAAGAFGFTPLSLAVASAQWGLVELLLRHGAHPVPSTSLYFASPEDEAHFASLLARVKAAKPRPPRSCPCWSGKLLSDCHAHSHQPYPDHFFCCCGKRRTFGACCGERGLDIAEIWSGKNGRIIPVHVIPQPSLNIPTELLAPSLVSTVTSVEARVDIRQYWDQIQWAFENKNELVRDKLVQLGLWSDVDPAYWYAGCHNEFFALPWTTKLSSLQGQARMNKWNTAVDAYISESSDKRSTFDIELEAKVDSHGGPRYKRCEANGCVSTEGREVEKMKCCSGCKRIMYCSQRCQTKDWKQHKKICASKTHPIQRLHSQQIFDRLLAMQESALQKSIASGIEGFFNAHSV
ncbi:hypothetical protein EIP86_007633 [Pleurotus ostreatoroseus]|nr:hypothetical protein EIP86_007633 [Pleurotus ostreatoroseus]